MSNIISRLNARLRSFGDDTRGSVSVEAALIFPMVMWSLLATFVFFEGYRQSAINHKAANTIADMYSRETESITPTYVNNTKELFDLLAEANGDTKIRISVVRWVSRRNEYQVDWSMVRGSNIVSLTTADLLSMADSLPTLPNQERIVLVETWSTYEPLFNIGMDDVEMHSFVFTRLRFAPQLRFCDTCS
ncbi:MAG: pilus assembly protein [Paracoccaceae bacterium]